MSAVGIKIDQFNVPVCNSFQAKILNDQLCYEVDLNKYKDKENMENYSKLGLVLFIDYNEDRQVKFFDEYEKSDFNSLVAAIDNSANIDDHQAFIYLNSIGKIKNII